MFDYLRYRIVRALMRPDEEILAMGLLYGHAYCSERAEKHAQMTYGASIAQQYYERRRDIQRLRDALDV